VFYSYLIIVAMFQIYSIIATEANALSVKWRIIVSHGYSGKSIPQVFVRFYVCLHRCNFESTLEKSKIAQSCWNLAQLYIGWISCIFFYFLKIFFWALGIKSIDRCQFPNLLY